MNEIHMPVSLSLLPNKKNSELHSRNMIIFFMYNIYRIRYIHMYLCATSLRLDPYPSMISSEQAGAPPDNTAGNK